SLLRCDLAETRKFVLALDGAHESSGRIHRIAADHVRRVGEGGEMRTVVEGLDAALRCAAAARALFSELGTLPWAVATEPFDLTGYSSYPRRIKGE
ncbi:MAG TPA: hypothetical protein P5532_23555, partial [Planctomycetota bacterium]|nr:hypothetical protein [Planctomycetota bacterium]